MPPETPIRSVTLDLDGTLLDTVPDLAEAARRMLADLGEPDCSDEEVRRFVGRGIPTLVRRCLSRRGEPDEDRVTLGTDRFRHHYADTNGQWSRPYPGVIDGLNRLTALGLPLAVITNKAAAFTDPLLDRSGLAPFFRFALSGDSLPERKPHPLPILEACARLDSSPARHLHIGDSKHDAGAARAAGCRILLVPYGYNEGDDVQDLDCDAIVGAITDAAAWLVAQR